MTTEKGQIDIKTENIFPIIKKFLYSDHEIFLRELISNAVDATQKLKTLVSTGTFKGEMGDITIQVKVDKKKKTITIRDRGIGMTADNFQLIKLKRNSDISKLPVISNVNLNRKSDDHGSIHGDELVRAFKIISY